MKYLAILFIVWSIFRAAQKAGKQQTAARQKLDERRKNLVASLGAVDDEPEPERARELTRDRRTLSGAQVSDDDTERWAALQANAAQFFSKGGQSATPLATETPLVPLPESVDEKLNASATETRRDMHEAYQEQTRTRRGIRLDAESLRTFFVTREVLGPPRSRSGFRPGFLSGFRSGIRK